MKQLYFIMTIDTECDKRKDWSVRHPFRFLNILESLPNKLYPLCARHRVKPTFLLSPEVIRDTNCVGVLKNLGGAYELGTHLHGEYVEPGADFSAKFTSDYQADYDYDTEYEKLVSLTRLFEKTFGYRPSSFRAGRFGLGPNTLKILSELKYKTDSSVFPMNRIKTLKNVLNFNGYPDKPYFPELNNHVKTVSPQNGRILEVPITVHSKLLSIFPRKLRHWISHVPYLTGLASKILGAKNVRPFSFRPTSLDEKELGSLMRSYIHRHDGDEPVFLTMMFHSSELYPGCSPYTESEKEATQLLDCIEKVMTDVNQLGAQSITLAESHDLMRPRDANV